LNSPARRRRATLQLAEIGTAGACNGNKQTFVHRDWHAAFDPS
jgi:hypothetical protein